MKRILIAGISLLITYSAFSQPSNNGSKPAGTIKLAAGQKITIETTTDIEASLTMGMELTGTTSSVNALEVKSVSANTSIVSSSLAKLKVNINMMGQASNYDSENKDSNNDEMARVFDNTLNKPVDIEVDNVTGSAVQKNSESKKKDPEESNPAADMIKMFSDNSDDAIVSGAFEIIPGGKTVGDSWSDTTSTKEIKMIRKYTLKSISGNEATIGVDIISTAVNKLDFQEMEFEIKTETKTKGEIISETTTGLVKKRTTTADITGSLQMMGQDMPISAKVTSTNTYR